MVETDLKAAPKEEDNDRLSTALAFFHPKLGSGSSSLLKLGPEPSSGQEVAISQILPHFFWGKNT